MPKQYPQFLVPAQSREGSGCGEVWEEGLGLAGRLAGCAGAQVLTLRRSWDCDIGALTWAFLRTMSFRYMAS